MKQMEFCLVTGDSLPAALQQLPGTLQQISKGNEFEISAMMCVPEMIMPAAGGLVNPGTRQQPRYQVSIVIAVKYDTAEDLPGMGSVAEDLTPGTSAAAAGSGNTLGFEDLKAFNQALQNSGLMRKSRHKKTGNQ